MRGQHWGPLFVDFPDTMGKYCCKCDTPNDEFRCLWKWTELSIGPAMWRQWSVIEESDEEDRLLSAFTQGSRCLRRIYNTNPPPENTNQETLIQD
eukprot:6490434-Amphidinium_carterae.11